MFSRATPRSKGQGFTCCGKTLFFEGYGLQPVHKRLKIGTALAAEGRISIRFPTFSAASLAPACGLTFPIESRRDGLRVAQDVVLGTDRRDKPVPQGRLKESRRPNDIIPLKRPPLAGEHEQSRTRSPPTLQRFDTRKGPSCLRHRQPSRGCFVSGPDFSRAVEAQQRCGL